MRKKDEPGNHLSYVNGTYKEIQTGVQEAANEYYSRFKGTKSVEKKCLNVLKHLQNSTITI